MFLQNLSNGGPGKRIGSEERDVFDSDSLQRSVFKNSGFSFGFLVNFYGLSVGFLASKLFILLNRSYADWAVNLDFSFNILAIFSKKIQRLAK